MGKGKVVGLVWTQEKNEQHKMAQMGIGMDVVRKEERGEAI